MDIKELREKINAIDLKILTLLNQRLRHVEKIGAIKKNGDSSFYVPSREREVFKDLLTHNNGPLSKESLKAIYREIMSASLAVEHKLQIAYLGPEGTYTHKAAVEKFGASVEYRAFHSIKDIFEEVKQMSCDYGVVPIENSTEGSVSYTLDMFVDYNLKICSEISIGIDHCLMTKHPKKPIEKIYSHPQAFGQCRQWLQKHYPKAVFHHTDSTSAAVQMAAREAGAAAIGSKTAATLFKLHILSSRIQDSPSNVTKFFIIGQESSKPSDSDKTSIVIGLDNQVGALAGAVDIFKQHLINMTKIESRPAKMIEPWRYLFFIDFEGHSQTPKVAEALSQLSKQCIFFKILGSYPKEV